MTAESTEKDALAYHLATGNEEPEVRTPTGWKPVSVILAQAWNEGHRYCTCDRPGATVHRNPYRALPPGGESRD